MEICFGIANGQILSIFDRVVCHNMSVFSFLEITLVNINGFSPKLVCALILWTSALGLLMGEFCPFLTELSVLHFQDNYFSKSQLDYHQT